MIFTWWHGNIVICIIHSLDKQGPLPSTWPLRPLQCTHTHIHPHLHTHTYVYSPVLWGHSSTPSYPTNNTKHPQHPRLNLNPTWRDETKMSQFPQNVLLFLMKYTFNIRYIAGGLTSALWAAQAAISRPHIWWAHQCWVELCTQWTSRGWIRLFISGRSPSPQSPTSSKTNKLCYLPLISLSSSSLLSTAERIGSPGE